MSELLNCGFFSRRLLKMYFKLPEWQEKIKNNNLKRLHFPLLLRRHIGFHTIWFPSTTFPNIHFRTRWEVHPPHSQQRDLLSCRCSELWMGGHFNCHLAIGIYGFSGCPWNCAESRDLDKLFTRSDKKTQTRITVPPSIKWGRKCKLTMWGGGLWCLNGVCVLKWLIPPGCHIA